MLLLITLIVSVQLFTNILASSFSQCSSYQHFPKNISQNSYQITFGPSYSLESLNAFQTPNYDLDLNFSISMSSDAYIILHSNLTDADLDNTDENMVAIGLGVDLGEYTYTRCSLIQKPRRFNYNCNVPLSVTNIKSFWLRLKDGTASLGLEGQTNSFLSWKTPDISKAKYVRFGSYRNVQGTFFFKCLEDKRPEFQPIGFTECLEYDTKSTLTQYDVFPLSYLVNIDRSYMVDLHFSVLIGSNARIILTSDPKMRELSSGHVYLIEIGRSGNTDCRISTKSKMYTLNCGNILSTNVQSFWLRMTFNGHFYLGNANDNNIILSWYDTFPLPVGYFAFTSYNNIQGRYYYNCTGVY